MKYARESLLEFDPSLRGDEEMATWYASFQRLAATPTSAPGHREDLLRDGRSVVAANDQERPDARLESGTGDSIEPVEAGKLIAAEYPGRPVRRARWVRPPRVGRPIEEAIVREIEEFLSDVQGEEADLDRVLATVLFTDIVDSTSQAAAMGDRRWRTVRERHDQIVRAQLARYQAGEIDTAGDGFLATFDGPARAVKCARATVDALREQGIEIRAGLHTGEVEFVDDKVRGIAVHIGARVASMAHPNHVLVSSTVKDLVTGSGLKFSDGGVHELKGVPGEWHLFDSEL